MRSAPAKMHEMSRMERRFKNPIKQLTVKIKMTIN